MANLRPYLVKHNGVERLVEATGQGPAKSHVVKAEIAKVKAGIESCRAATGTDVAAFVRAGGKIETAGVTPEEPTVEEDGAERARRLLGGDQNAAEAEEEGKA